MDTSYEALLAHLYDAVIDPKGFQTFIEKLIQSYNLKAVTMVIRNVQSGEIRGLWLSGIEMRWVESYALEYGQQDILAAHINQFPIAHFYASNLDLAPTHHINNRFYSEWLVPQGVAHAAGAIVLQEGEWLTQIILQRGNGHQAFSRGDMDRLNALVPHIQRAIQMRQRFSELEVNQNYLVRGLDVLAMPTLLFDEYGKVSHCNQSACRYFETDHHLKITDGHLQAKDNLTNRKIGSEISKALLSSRGDFKDINSVVLIARTDQLPLMLMVSPLPIRDKTHLHSGALLFVFDPEKTPSITKDLVRKLFGLSVAEADLAISLCCGKTLEDVAHVRGTSINTIKSQLKSSFIKTGTRRQCELISLLLASPAYFLSQHKN